MCIQNKLLVELDFPDSISRESLDLGRKPSVKHNNCLKKGSYNVASECFLIRTLYIRL